MPRHAVAALTLLTALVVSTRTLAEENGPQSARPTGYPTTSAIFTCDSGRPVPVSYRCDENDDCGDGSDEAGCEEFFVELERLGKQIVDLSGKGLHREALPVAKRGLAITEKTCGPEHPYTSEMLVGISMLLEELGDLRAARPLSERAP